MEPGALSAVGSAVLTAASGCPVFTSTHDADGGSVPQRGQTGQPARLFLLLEVKGYKRQQGREQAGFLQGSARLSLG